MKKQGKTVILCASLPEDLTEQIIRELYVYRCQEGQQNTSRSKFIAKLIRKGLEA